MPLTAMDLVAAAKQNIREVSVADAQSHMGRIRILDVREPAEYSAGCLPGAVNLPRGVLEFKIGTLPDFKEDLDSPILVYCQSGGRSALAAEALQKLGYQPLSLAGGIAAWKDAGGSIVTPA